MNATTALARGERGDVALRERLGERTAARGCLAAVLVLAAALETWALTAGGYGNGYYAEAVQAASRSWRALALGAADPSGLSSLDKGPLGVWVAALFSRVLGFGPLSVLLPSAICAVAAVALLHDAVRRTLGPGTALLAALMLALTPVSVMMGRYDNPDALLALLLVASAWALVRALESGRTRHVLWCGAFVGLAIETKMLEACLIVPGLAGAYLLAGRGPLRARAARLLGGGAVALAVGLAWFEAMMLIPASARPSVPDGNSWFGLMVQTNGLQRVTGFGSGHSSAGPLRLFAPQIAGQASWLLPLAALGLPAGMWALTRAPRADRRRAALVLFGLWLLAGWLVLSFSRGIFHSYYTSAIAPAIAALAASAIVTLASHARASRAAAAALAGALCGTALLAWTVLGHTPAFAPGLRWAVLGAGALAACAALALLGAPRVRGPLAPAFACAAALALLGGPAAYSIATVGTAHSGSSPTAGPRGLTPARDRPEGALAAPRPALITWLEHRRAGARYLLAATGSDFAAPIGLASGAPVVTLGGFDGAGAVPSVSQLAALVRAGQVRYVLLALPEPSPAALARSRWVAGSCRAVTAPGLDRRELWENGTPLGGVGTRRAAVAAGLYRCPGASA